MTFEMWTTEANMKFLSGQSPIPSIILIAGLMIFWMYHRWPFEFSQWNNFEKTEKIFTVIDFSLTVLFVFACLEGIRNHIDMMSFDEQFLFSTGLAIGSAVSLLIVIMGGFVGLFATNFLDLIVSNLKMIRHITCFISSAFMGIYFGLHIYQISDKAVWEPTIERIIALFFALLLIGWVYGVIQHAVESRPVIREKSAPSDWLYRKFVAVRNRVWASKFYRKYDNQLKAKRFLNTLISSLFVIMMFASMQIIVSLMYKNLNVQVDDLTTRSLFAIMNFFIFASIIIVVGLSIMRMIKLKR